MENPDAIQFIQLLTENRKRVKPHTWKNKDGTPNIKNHKIYAEYLCKQLGYTKMEDWYKITGIKIKRNYGGGLLANRYNDSPIDFVKAVFPDYEWLEWKFRNVPKRFWNDKKNHKIFAEYLGKILGYTEKKDWYQITKIQITRNYGCGLLQLYYNNCAIDFVKAVFPDDEWLEWKFDKAPRGFWNDKKNHKRYINWLENELGYTKKKDWYQITYIQIKRNYGSGLLWYYNSSPVKLVMETYPEYSWDQSKFKKIYSRGQIEWLNFMLVSTPDITHILNNDNGEFYIPESREITGRGVGYHADGYSEKENTVFEYLGDFWHGNPTKYNPKDINPLTKTTYGSLYDKEKEREQFCIQKGFKYYSIWESEWLKGKLTIIKLQTIFKNKRKP